MKTPDFEIGDSVVFARPVEHYSKSDPRWRTGKVVDVVGKLVEVEFRSMFGFYRRKWLSPTGLHQHGWMIHRKDRADEMIARYQSNQ